MDKLAFKSINTLELGTSLTEISGVNMVDLVNLNVINECLEYGQIVRKKLFIILHVVADCQEWNMFGFPFKLFQTLIQNVCNLILSKIPIDIKITLTNFATTNFKQCLSIYSASLENEIFLEEYNQPQCNSQLCVPRVAPYTNFVMSKNVQPTGSLDVSPCVFNATNVERV